jgi:hypothetical protein
MVSEAEGKFLVVGVMHFYFLMKFAFSQNKGLGKFWDILYLHLWLQFNTDGTCSRIKDSCDSWRIHIESVQRYSVSVIIWRLIVGEGHLLDAINPRIHQIVAVSE